LAQELVDQIAVSAVDLHAIKPGLNGIQSGLAIVRDDVLNVLA
jgi:hypothetical protein